MDISPVKTEADYEQALQRVEELWGAEPGSTQGDELDLLVALIEAYEREHYSQLYKPWPEAPPNIH